MRSIPIEDLKHLAPKITKGPVNPMLAALEAFPNQLAAALAAMPAAVLAPRPAGAWVIDVARDSKGRVCTMTANFHQTNA